MASPQAGPGAELRAAREGMEVSTREVADALNLPAQVIEALEADDYERLPPTVFTRGYLRSYARLLELDPDPLLAIYPEMTEEVEVVAVESGAGTGTLVSQNQIIGLAVGGGILLILLLVWLLSGDEEGETPSGDPVAGDLAPEQAVPEPEPESESELQPESAPDAEVPTRRPVEEAQPTDRTLTREPVETTPVEPPAVVEREESAAEPPVADPVTPVPAPRQIETRPEEPAAVVDEPAVTVPSSTVRPAAGQVTRSRVERRITEFGDDEMTLVFAEDCWVEVKTLEGENLYSDLNRTGRTLVLSGRGPFRLLLGYAPGVSLSFNGEVVSLDRYSRNNVANLVLGE